MKNMILDTHTVLWFLNGEKLNEKAKELIINGANYISVASLWEVAIKMNIGKYSFDGGYSAFRELVENNRFNILPIKDGYLERLFTLPLIHRDPFDRLIIASALVEDLTIITIDENIQKYDVPWIW
jgi:PIN domain nuclease of toxin-antitoxin system